MDTLEVRASSSRDEIQLTVWRIGSIEALPRMHDIRYRMVDRGVQAVPLQPHWCALRPGKKSLVYL
jgi:hypothetical protein